MIAQLRGHIVRKDDTQIVIDVQGVGYAVVVSGKSASQLFIGNDEVTLLAEMQVREDSMTLFGFLDASEKDAFKLLISVQGVGAKAAMAILSVLSPDQLSQAIMAKDKAMVARADGVGPKIAQRVVNELAEKIGKIETLGGALPIRINDDAGTDRQPGLCRDAISALVNLGYGQSEAHGAVLRALSSRPDADLSSLIGAALQEMSQ